MSTDNTIGLIGYLGVIILVLLGLRLIFTGFRGSARGLSPPGGFGQGVFGRTVANLLSFAVAFKFLFEGYAGKVYGYEAMLTMAVFTLLAMALLPFVETLVAIAALTVFLMNNTATFGQAALGAFVGLLVVFSLLRWLFGR